MALKEFKQYWLAEFVEPKCAVTDFEGNHCPGKPEHFIKDHGSKLKPVDEIGLCKRCYINYKNGTFDYPKRAKRSGGKVFNSQQQAKVAIINTATICSTL